MKLKLLAILSLFSSTLYAAQYVPADLSKFSSTGKCASCDLSSARLPSFDNADLSNASLIRANLSYNDHHSSNFSSANLSYANLYYTKAAGSNFSKANFTGAELERASLSSCDFKGANFTGANLVYADLTNSNATSAQLAKAKSLSCTVMPNGTRHEKEGGGSC